MGTSVLEAVRALGPSIAERSSEIERERRLPLDIVEMLKPTGAFRMYAPVELNGPAVSPWESLEAISELAYHDGAVGWCSMIGSTTSLMSYRMADEHARDVFGSVDSIAGGFVPPVGRAVPVDGGLKVTGRWAWGSGTQHCTYVGGGCLVVDEHGTPTARADGLAAPFVFFDPADVEWLDNWDVSGMCGSGSGDYQVSEAFVPEGRWVELLTEDAPRKHPLASISFFGLLACGVASCAVGIGRRAIDELIELAGAKTPQGSSKPLATRTPVQADVAIAEAKLKSAWAFMSEAVVDSWESAQQLAEPTNEQKRLLRLSATHATQTAAEVAELMYKAAGGAAVYKTSPIQRTFRDAYVATQHAMVAPRTMEMYGRMKLGLDTNTATL